MTAKNKPPIQDQLNTVIDAATKAAIAEAKGRQSRILVKLWPNVTRIDIVLNDRKFNNERYGFSRAEEAKDRELSMICAIEAIVGIERAQPEKNKISLEISDGMLPSELIPEVLEYVKDFGKYATPPAIFVEDARYTVSPKYDKNGWTCTEGVRVQPGTVDIGVPYQVWVPEQRQG